MTREEGRQQGGHTQSQKEHYCVQCDQIGFGNRFKGHHINQGLCDGQGVKNYYSKQLNKGPRWRIF